MRALETVICRYAALDRTGTGTKIQSVSISHNNTIGLGSGGYEAAENRLDILITFTN